MGYLEEYGIGADTITSPQRKIAKEGRYFFEIGDAVLRKGTKNAPKDVFVLFTYQLSDYDGEPQGSVDEKFWVRRNGVYDDTCKQSMGYLDRRLKDMGFEGGVDDPEYTNDAVIGFRGKLRVEHSTGKDQRVFANPRDIEFIFDDGDDDEPVSDQPSDYDDNDPRQDKAAANKAAAEAAAETAAPRAPRGRGRTAQASPAADNPWGDDE